MKRVLVCGDVDRASLLGNRPLVARYADVARTLERKFRDTRITPEFVVGLACDLLQFMEEALSPGRDESGDGAAAAKNAEGKKAPPPLTRIDALAFRDVAVKGALHVMLKAAFKKQLEDGNVRWLLRCCLVLAQHSEPGQTLLRATVAVRAAAETA
jgi:hypothetical protein